MSVAKGRPPSLTNEESSKVITRHFSFKEVNNASIKAFPSYRDRNYFFQGESTESSDNEFVFKLSNPLSSSFSVMEGVNEVMRHLNSRNLQSPYPLSSRTGKDLIQLSSAELKGSADEEKSMKYPVYVLSFIPGDIFDHVDKRHLTPELLYEVGELLGKIDKELMVCYPNGMCMVCMYQCFSPMTG